MSPEQFEGFVARLRAVSPQMQGAMLISAEGVVLHQEGEAVADQTLIGIAGAAVVRLAGHIGAGLAACPLQEITLCCDPHAVLFLPMGEETLMMIVMPVEADTRPLARAIRACLNGQAVFAEVSR